MSLWNNTQARVGEEQELGCTDLGLGRKQGGWNSLPILQIGALRHWEGPRL